MKLGVSTYSLSQAIVSAELSVPDCISLIAEMGGEHAEIVPVGFSLTDQPALVGAIIQRAEEAGIELSGYCVGANFADLDGKAFEAEVRRVMGHVEIASALGVKRMRHDVASSSDVSVRHFLAQLPRLAEACRRIADYAAGFGITTSVENHGYFIQASERVQALLHAVDRPNFKTTLDVGNFLCVDEAPAAAAGRNIGFASMVHIKDFYYRPAERNPGEGWFATSGGNWLRGAISGHGDIDLKRVLGIVKRSGYDGYLSLEFEGMEECRTGTRLGLNSVRRIWNEIEL
ncbi:MAG: sugar phosphate isomerase [Paenibacillaceae bacterium]|jgi:sugar phosphate isomerase/epimerase|nr:sugar phosphate isomerase [Paenibacillaceae bacterium]